MTPGISLDRQAPKCNLAVENFLNQRHQEVHRRNVDNSKTKIKNTWTAREEERIHASRRNLKREQVQSEGFSRIEKENLRLLVRMNDIETRGPAKAAAMLTLGTGSSRSSSSLPPPGLASKSTQKVRELKRIDFENQRMLKRLQCAKSSVDVKKSEQAHAKQQQIMRMRMENPNDARMSEARAANRALLPPRLPTPDPTHDDECDRLMQLRNQLLARAGLDIPKEDDEESQGEASLRRSRSCGEFGSRLGTPSTGAAAGAGDDGAHHLSKSRQPSPARAARSPLAIFSAGTIPQNSKDIVEKLFAEHRREAKTEEENEAEVEDAKEAAAAALRAAEAIDLSSIDVMGRGEDFLSYGNIIQRGKAAQGRFDG